MNRFQRIYSLARLLAVRGASVDAALSEKYTTETSSAKLSSMPSKLFSRKQQLLELEGRLLFDAAAGVTGLELGSDALDGIDPLLDDVDDGEFLDPAVSAILADVLDFTSAPFSKTLVFIDSAVSDLSAFLDVGNPSLEFIQITNEDSGLTQIADAMAGRTDVSAVHIISHGQAGALQLGGSTITRSDLADYGAELAIIGDALSGDADILIYGCNVAEGSIGQKFIQSFSRLTGADIAASADWTGDVAQGGDWELEETIGDIDVAALFGVDGDIGYSNLLAAPTIDAPIAVNTFEDIPHTFVDFFGSQTVSVDDLDGDNLVVSVSVSYGTMTLSGGSAASVSGSGTSTLFVSGSIGDINTELATLIYTPDMNYVGSDTLAISVNDATAVTVSSTAITVNGINDAPTISNPALYNVDEDTSTIIPGIALSDVDDNGGTFTVELLVANGTLDIDQSGITITYRSANSDAFALSGTKVALNAALATLSYQGELNFNGIDSLQISVNDNGNSGFGGSLVGLANVALTVLPVNDEPILSFPASGYDVISGETLGLFGLSVDDVDADPALDMLLTISTSNGLLSYSGSEVPIAGTASGDTALVFAGRPAVINAILADLSYTSATGFVGTDQIRVQVSDDGGSSGGPSLVSDDLIDVGVGVETDADFNVSDAEILENSSDLIETLGGPNGQGSISFPPPKFTVSSAIGEFRVANDSEPMRAIVEGRADDFDMQFSGSGDENSVRASLSLDEEPRDFKANVLSPTGLVDGIDGDLDITDASESENNADEESSNDANQEAPDNADETNLDTNEASSISEAIKLSADRFDRNVDQLLNDLGASGSSDEE